MSRSINESINQLQTALNDIINSSKNNRELALEYKITVPQVRIIKESLDL